MSDCVVDMAIEVLPFRCVVEVCTVEELSNGVLEGKSLVDGDAIDDAGVTVTAGGTVCMVRIETILTVEIRTWGEAAGADRVVSEVTVSTDAV